MFQDDCLHGKVALITGASAGIGQTTTKTFAKYGADVAVAARREEKLETLVNEVEQEYGVEGLVIPTDIRDPSSVEAMVSATIDGFDGLDILVCNAGVVGRSQGFEASPGSSHGHRSHCTVPRNGGSAGLRTTSARRRANTGSASR